jgi:hypothetical protein
MTLLAMAVSWVVRRLWRCRTSAPAEPAVAPIAARPGRRLGVLVVRSVVVADDDVLIGYSTPAADDVSGTLLLTGLAAPDSSVALLERWRRERTVLAGYVVDTGPALVDPARGTVVASGPASR